jgi:putative ABC transport system ATP-binding protein
VTPAPLISIEGVSKVYRRDAIEIPVLQDINLSLPAGEFISLMGPSGSGKTTLLNLIAGLDQPTRGRIRIGGEDISTMNEGTLATWRSENIGLIFQLYNLIPVLTAFENVELPLFLTDLSKKDRREHAEAALAIVGLADRMDHFPRQLSGGQEQRVAIARAIVTDPLILVADEPTGDLDAKSADDILRLLGRLNTEFDKTIVMVTHDPNAAACARVIVHLDKGVLRESMAMPAVATAPPPAAAGNVPKPPGPPEAPAQYGPFSEGFVPRSEAETDEELQSQRRAWAREVAQGFEGLAPNEVVELMKRLEGLPQSGPGREPSRGRPRPVSAPGVPAPGVRRPGDS